MNINESTKTLISELVNHYGMHWLTRNAYGDVEAHMDMPHDVDGEWSSDDVSGNGTHCLWVGRTLVENVICDRDLDIDADDVDMTFVTEEESPIYMDDLVPTDPSTRTTPAARNRRNLELAERIVGLLTDMGDDPEDTEDAVRRLYARLNGERDDFFHDVLNTIADVMDDYIE